MIRTFIATILIAFSGLCISALPLLGSTTSEITARMKERLGVVDDLKLAGKLGENNEALLEARGSLTAEERKIVEAQNKDRSALYRIIAERNNTSESVVAKQRAQQIAKQTKAGIWLQKANGEWYQK